MPSTSRIVITGASGGIGKALARDYARPGISLVLTGRNAARLDAVAAACRETGAEVETMVLDIRDRDATKAALCKVDEAGPIDLLIANAGVQLPTREDLGDLASSYDEIETNLLGTLNTVVPVAARMAVRRQGQIALVSSLAAYAPLPDSPGYSGSKAGLLVWGLSLRGRLRAAGVKVSVVCPGYVDAGMGHRFKGWKLRVLPVARTAAIIRRGLEADRAVIAFPFPLTWVTRLMQFMPEWLGILVQRTSRFRVEAQP